MAKKLPEKIVLPTPAPTQTISDSTTKARPLIFVSHDHRDAPLAEGFSNLLTDASGGFLKSFRSSDRKGGAGIEFGAEWYSEIMNKIDAATDVVGLLTPNSVDRPWILYEAGVAKGKLGKPVFGLVVGVSFDQATKGPFAQFQNSADDEDSLTKLVLQLIKRNSDAEPREEAVRRQVSAFRATISTLTAGNADAKPSKPGDTEANDAAKLFEEIKVMFRDLPDRLHGQISESFGPRFRRRPKMHRELMSMIMHEGPGLEDPALAWLMTISILREDAPWLYELGLDLHKALKLGDPQRLNKAVNQFQKSIDLLTHGPFSRMLIDSPEVEMAIHQLDRLSHTLLIRASEPPWAPPRQIRKLDDAKRKKDDVTPDV